MEVLVLIVVVIAVAVLAAFAVLITGVLSVEGGLLGLAINAVLGLLLLFFTNLFVSPPIPINIITILICALGGAVGWVVVLLLHLLRIAFYVPAVIVLFT
jgi:hypothetical protein